LTLKEQFLLKKLSALFNLVPTKSPADTFLETFKSKEVMYRV